MDLKEYRNKRLFQKTPEPKGGPIRKGRGPLRFVVQMHEATRLHFDFRIEVGGVFKSWAVPKGPSLNVMDQRLAVYVEDHPIEYGSFEGIIPKGNYGAGTVMIWDAGTFLERGSANRTESEAALKKGLKAGHITLLLEGHKLRGEFALVRLKKKEGEKAWLLLKKRDGYSNYKDVTLQDRSILSGRTISEIAKESSERGDVWLPGKGHAGKKKPVAIPDPPKLPKPTPKLATPQFRAPKPGKATAETLPRKFKPMLAVMGSQAFDDAHWIFEVSQGHRALAAVSQGSVQLYSKQLLSFNSKYPALVGALKELPQRLLLDGEVIEDGSYCVHDLLHLDGKSLRSLPLSERKKILEGLPIFSGPIRRVAYSHKCGIRYAEKAAAEGHEWIVAKEQGSHYESGVSPAWIKIKIVIDSAKETSRSPLTHLDKVYWPREKFTKGDVVEYYRQVAPYILPYLKDRPESLHRHPNGIAAESFFHKDMTGYLPKWLKTERIYSESSAKSVNYALCQDEASLLYLVNLGCIELNPWISRVGHLDHPDFVVIDLDPDGNAFDDVIRVGIEVHNVLKKIGAQSFCKTSGSSGLHICVPIQAKYDYDTARDWALAVCRKVHEKFPKLTSLERSPSKRRGLIYLDYLQNRRGATLAAPYCVRPKPGATVSAPLKWSELKKGLKLESFTMKNLLSRLKKVGDLWQGMLSTQVDLEKTLKRLR